jgi:predicted Zn-dependent protease
LVENSKNIKLLTSDELFELEKKYPFASFVNVLINKNHYEENDTISIVELVNLVNKTDNPGLAFVSIVTKTKKQKKTKSVALKNPLGRIKVEREKIAMDKSSFLRIDVVRENINIEAEFDETIKNKKEIYSKEKKNIKENVSISVEKEEIFDLKNDIASEQLADIYLKQGMKKEAIEMYRRLSLQKSEKSVYFAEILKKLIKT